VDRIGIIVVSHLGLLSGRGHGDRRSRHKERGAEARAEGLETDQWSPWTREVWVFMTAEKLGVLILLYMAVWGKATGFSRLLSRMGSPDSWVALLASPQAEKWEQSLSHPAMPFLLCIRRMVIPDTRRGESAPFSSRIFGPATRRPRLVRILGVALNSVPLVRT
jgi:hypothetical protein